MTIATNSDSTTEGDECFQIEPSTSTSGWDDQNPRGAQKQAVLIVDGDCSNCQIVEPVRVAGVWLAAAEPNPVDEGSAVTVTARLSAALSSDVTIPLTLTDDTAEAGDHGALAGITIPAGSVSASGTVTTSQDTDTEDETFAVALDRTNLPSGVAAFTPSSIMVTITDDDANPHAALIAKVKGWRDDPRYSSNKAHTDRWDRVLLTLGAAVADTSLTRMGAAEAQGYADRGWTRWVEVAAALKQIENGGTQTPVPVMSIAAGAGVTEGSSATFTLTANPAPATALTVAVTVSQSGDYAASGAIGSRTVTVPTGGTASFTVATVDDGTDEADGSVAATLAAGTGYTVSASQGAATVAVTDNDDAPSANPYAALIAKMYGWRNGNGEWSSNKEHTDRWDRALLAFGETVADSSLTPMTTAEAQAFADRGWTPWVEVAAALREIEGGGGTTTTTPELFIAAGTGVTEGGSASFTITARPAPSAALTVAVTVSQRGDYAAPGATGARQVTVPTGGTASFTVATVDDAADEADGSVTATLASGTGYTVSASQGAATAAVSDNDAAVVLPGIVTGRTLAREGAGAAAVFTVRLDRAASGTVTVDYATADGAGRWAGTAPARAGADYTATSGTLAFAAGETEKTVSVPILDDSIDEGIEYFLLRFSNPQGATLEAGHRVTQGLIRNSDPLQAMWLSRFGRTVASDAVAALTARFETPRDAGSHLTMLGQRVNLSQDGSGDGAGAQALAGVLTGFAQAFGAQAPAANDDDPFARHGLTHGWNGPAGVTTAPAPTGRDLLLGTSFRAVLSSGPGMQLTSWGQGASVSQFSAAVPGLGLTGETATGSMGFDYERGRLLTGFAMLHSVGDGTARDAGWRYAMGSTATTVLPYARLALTDRLSAWAMAGTGTGRLSLDIDGTVPQSYRTDLAMTLAATGVRGDLLTPAEAGGFALALKADAFWVRTESDGVSASGFGSLMGARGESSRVRAVLDGSRTFALTSGATLSPSVELGVRHDGGDAETGTGLEYGAGLGYADPARGLDMALRVHGLAMHAEDRYSEWGVSGQLRLVPGDAGRGLSASLTPSYGVDAGGTQRLWAVPDASRLTANGEAVPSSRLDAEMGYGMALFGDRFTGTPNVGFGMSDTAREYRMGWRLTSAVRGDPGFEVNLDATRREAANADEPAEHGVMLRSLVRW